MRYTRGGQRALKWRRRVVKAANERTVRIHGSSRGCPAGIPSESVDAEVMRIVFVQGMEGEEEVAASAIAGPMSLRSSRLR